VSAGPDQTVTLPADVTLDGWLVADYMVDRSTIAKLRVVARDGAFDALARSRPGARDKAIFQMIDNLPR